MLRPLSGTGRILLGDQVHFFPCERPVKLKAHLISNRVRVTRTKRHDAVIFNELAAPEAEVLCQYFGFNPRGFWKVARRVSAGESAYSDLGLHFILRPGLTGRPPDRK